MDNDTMPVVAGLAVGVGFVIIMMVVVGSLTTYDTPESEDVDAGGSSVDTLIFGNEVRVEVNTDPTVFEPDASGDELNDDVYQFAFKQGDIEDIMNRTKDGITS